MNEDLLKRFAETWKMTQGTLTKEEFTKAVEAMMKIIVQMEKRNQQAIAKLQQDHASFMQNESGNHEMTLADMKKQVNQVFIGERMDEMKKMMNEMIDSAMQKMHGKMSEVDSKMSKVRDGYTPQKGKDYFDGTHGNKVTPIEVRDKLEILKDGQKLSVQAIEGLTKLLEDLNVKSSRVVSGGLISKRIRFVDDETPSGSGTAFTISRAPETGSFKLYRGGARQRVTEDYTLDGKNLTLNVTLSTNEILLCDFRY